MASVGAASCSRVFFFSSRRRHTRFSRDWSSDVCSSDLPKTLSESLAIMTDMARKGHIDVDMFRLFLRDRVFLTYAKVFLLPAQIDEVDEQVYLAMLND